MVIQRFWSLEYRKDRLSQNVGDELPKTRCVTTQKSAALIYFAVEA